MSVPNFVCPKCGEKMHKTHVVNGKMTPVGWAVQRLYLCDFNHEYWRTEDDRTKLSWEESWEEND